MNNPGPNDIPVTDRQMDYLIQLADKQSKIVVFDRYLFAVSVKGNVIGVSRTDGALQVLFDGDNPGGINVTRYSGKYFHHQQCYTYLEPGHGGLRPIIDGCGVVSSNEEKGDGNSYMDMVPGIDPDPISSTHPRTAGPGGGTTETRCLINSRTCSKCGEEIMARTQLEVRSLMYGVYGKCPVCEEWTVPIITAPNGNGVGDG